MKLAEAIKEVLRDHVCVTQEEIINHLEAIGVKRSQASVSRMLKRLGVGKLPQPDGTYRICLQPDFGEQLAHIIEHVLDFEKRLGQLTARVCELEAKDA